MDHPKALYRRAIAHAMLGNYEEAEQDFLRTKEVGRLHVGLHLVPLPAALSPRGNSVRPGLVLQSDTIVVQHFLHHVFPDVVLLVADLVVCSMLQSSAVMICRLGVGEGCGRWQVNSCQRLSESACVGGACAWRLHVRVRPPVPAGCGVDGTGRKVSAVLSDYVGGKNPKPYHALGK